LSHAFHLFAELLISLGILLAPKDNQAIILSHCMDLLVHFPFADRLGVVNHHLKFARLELVEVKSTEAEFISPSLMCLSPGLWHLMVGN
jgi:hypothetical protein